MPPRPILIDTDPGQDDAVAILLALASPDELEVRAIVAVAGNVPLGLTERNARIVRDIAGRPDVPVHAGADRPLIRPLRTAEHVHGRTGLDGPPLPEPRGALDSEPGVDAIVRNLREAGPDGLTICALGPLTDVALALRAAPDALGNLREIVLMGGAYFEVGNITPAAEFNIYVDPDAAAEVFACGRPITVLPLDVTHKALTTAARVRAFRDLGTEAGRMVAAWTDFFERFDKEKYGSLGAPLHDPCVIAWLLAPGLFSGRHVNVEVETQSDLTRGMTVADWWGVTDRAANATFIGDVDADGFFTLLTERIGRLP